MLAIQQRLERRALEQHNATVALQQRLHRNNCAMLPAAAPCVATAVESQQAFLLPLPASQPRLGRSKPFVDISLVLQTCLKLMALWLQREAWSTKKSRWSLLIFMVVFENAFGP